MFPALCLLGLATLGVAIPTTQHQQRRGLPVLGGAGGDGSDGSDILTLPQGGDLPVLGGGSSGGDASSAFSALGALGGDGSAGYDTITIPHGGALQGADTLVIHGASAGSAELEQLGAPDLLKDGGAVDGVEDQATGDDSKQQQQHDARGLPVGGLGGGQAVLLMLREIVSEATASSDAHTIAMPQTLLTVATNVLHGLTRGSGGSSGSGGGVVGGIPTEESDSHTSDTRRSLPVVGGSRFSPSSPAAGPGAGKATGLLAQIVRGATVADVGGVQLPSRILRTATLVLNQAGVGL